MTARAQPLADRLRGRWSTCSCSRRSSILILFSFNASTHGTSSGSGFTLDWYPRLFDNRDLLDALWVTLAGRARRGHRRDDPRHAARPRAGAAAQFRRRGATETLLLLPMVTPEIVMGISLLLFFGQLFDVNGLDRPDLDRPHHVLHLVRGGGRPGAGGRTSTRSSRRPPATSGRRRGARSGT